MINKRRAIFLIIWFSIFVLALGMKNNVAIILYGLAIILPIYFRKDIRDGIITMMYLLISTPIIGNSTSIFSIKSFTILDIAIISMFVIVILRYLKKYKGIRKNFNFLDKLVLAYFILNFVALIKGIMHNGGSAIEVKFVFIPVILYFTFKFSEIKIDIKTIFSIIFNSVAIYSVIILIIIKLLDISSLGLIDYEGRIAINLTLYIFTIVYGVYMLLKYNITKKNKMLILLILIIEIYLYSLNISRTVLLLIVLGLILMYIITYFDTNKNININIVINILSIIVIGMLCIIIYKYLNEFIEPIIRRLREMIDKSGSYSNFSVRTQTAQYYRPIIASSILGAGWGAEMILLHPEGYTIYGNGFMDNFFITLGYKAGIVICINYILILLFAYLRIFKLGVKKKKEYKLIMILMPLLIIATNYITCQAYHTMTTTSVLWIIIYFSYIESETNINSKKIE